jgi:hypothetical protein
MLMKNDLFGALLAIQQMLTELKLNSLVMSLFVCFSIVDGKL